MGSSGSSFCSTTQFRCAEAEWRLQETVKLNKLLDNISHSLLLHTSRATLAGEDKNVWLRSDSSRVPDRADGQQRSRYIDSHWGGMLLHPDGAAEILRTTLNWNISTHFHRVSRERTWAYGHMVLYSQSLFFLWFKMNSRSEQTCQKPSCNFYATLIQQLSQVFEEWRWESLVAGK